MKTKCEKPKCFTCGKEFLRKIAGSGRKKLAIRPSSAINCSKECSREYSRPKAKYLRKKNENNNRNTRKNK